MVASDQTILEFKGKRKWMWQRKLENCDFPTTVAIVQLSYEEKWFKARFWKIWTGKNGWGECVWFMLIEERGFEEERWLECWLPLKAPRLCWEKPNQASTTGHSGCFTRLGLVRSGQLGHKVTSNDLKVTPIILLTASALLSTNQFFGEPIQCDLPGGGVSAETLRSYCWMYSTFSMPAGFQVGSLTVFKLSILVFAQFERLSRSCVFSPKPSQAACI